MLIQDYLCKNVCVLNVRYLKKMLSIHRRGLVSAVEHRLANMNHRGRDARSLAILGVYIRSIARALGLALFMRTAT